MTEVAAVIAPRELTAKLVPAITLVPVPVPNVNVPVPLALRVSPVSVVEGEITGFTPEKVRVEAPSVSVFIVPSTTKLPEACKLAPTAVREVAPFDDRTIFPVVELPNVRLCMLVVASIPAPDK